MGRATGLGPATTIAVPCGACPVPYRPCRSSASAASSPTASSASPRRPSRDLEPGVGRHLPGRGGAQRRGEPRPARPSPGARLRHRRRHGRRVAGRARVRAAASTPAASARVPAEPTAEYLAILAPDGELVLGVAVMAILDGLDAADVDAAWPDDAGPRPASCSTATRRPSVLAHALRARPRVPTTVRLVVVAVSAPKVVRLPADLTGVDLFVLHPRRGAGLARRRRGGSRTWGRTTRPWPTDLAAAAAVARAAHARRAHPRRRRRARPRTPTASSRCAASRSRSSTSPAAATPSSRARCPRSSPGAELGRRRPPRRPARRA